MRDARTMMADEAEVDASGAAKSGAIVGVSYDGRAAQDQAEGGMLTINVVVSRIETGAGDTATGKVKLYLAGDDTERTGDVNRATTAAKWRQEIGVYTPGAAGVTKTPSSAVASGDSPYRFQYRLQPGVRSRFIRLEADVPRHVEITVSADLGTPKQNNFFYPTTSGKQAVPAV